MQKQKHKTSASEPFAMVVMFVVMMVVVGFWQLYTSHFEAVAALDVPQLISFQGKLTDQNRITVTDSARNMKFVIYDAASGGNCLWSAGNTDANTATVDCASPGSISISTVDGVFFVLLGDTTGGTQNALPDTLFDDNAALYLGVTVGTDAEMSPRTRLASTPYALQAGDADLLDSFNTSQAGGNSVVLVTESDGDLALTAAVNIVNTSTNRTDTAALIDVDSESTDSADRVIEITSDFGADETVHFFVTTSGGVFISAAEDSERIRLNDTTNADSASLYVGDGTTGLDGTLSAQAGSIFLDEDGLLWVNRNNAGNWDQAALSDGGAADFLRANVSDTFEGIHTRTLTVQSDLTVAGRSVNLLSISQANNASNNLTAPLVQIDQQDTASSSGVALDINQTSSASALVVDVSGTGAGLDVNNTSGGGKAIDIDVTGANHNGDIMEGHVVSTYNASRNVSSQGVLFGRVLTIDDGGAGTATINVLDDTLRVFFQGTETSGNITHAGNVASFAQSFAEATGAVVEIENVGTGAGLKVGSTSGTAASGETSALLYLTEVDAANRYGLYIDTEESTQTQTIIALESDTVNGSGADTLKFRVDASGEAFSDVGFSSGATTKYADGIIHKTDPGTFSLYTFGGADDDILFDETTLTVETDENQVGIGTRDPQAYLDVRGVDGMEFIRLTGSSDAVGIFTGSSTPTFSAPGGSLYLMSDAGGTQGPNLYLNTSSTDSGSEWTIVNGTNTSTTEINQYISSGGGGSPSPDSLDELYNWDDDKVLALAIEGLTLDAALTDSAIAEEFASTDTLSVGDLVRRDLSGTTDVLATTASYDSALLGIVTETPALLVSRTDGYAVAHTGEVTVKVSDENGAIVIGDPLTSSATAGTAMKATEPGVIVGFALDDFAGPGTGTITVSLNPHWYAGNILTTDGTSTFIEDAIVMDAAGEADEMTPGFASRVFSLRGSGWDVVDLAAEAVEMKLMTDVTDASDYRLSIMNTSDAQVAYVNEEGDLAVAGRLYPSDRGVLQTDKYIYYDGDAGFGGDFMRTNASGWGTGSYDFAEMFPSDETLESGDVVVFASENEHVGKTSEAYSATIAGIVSTRPGFLAGDNNEDHYPIALAGRVPTKVTTENGPIEIGDPLTTATRVGYAMKATEPGPIVGYALEPFDGTGADDLVIAFVNVSYFGGDEQLPLAGTDNEASEVIVTTSSNLTSLNMDGDINMNAHAIRNVAVLAGIGSRWSINEDGLFGTRQSYDVVVESYQGEDIVTHTTLSMQHMITLSGSAALSGGSAAIRFEDVEPTFNDVISTVAPIRVFVTLRENANGVFVSEADEDGFTVQETMNGASDAQFDWFVEAYRKDREPVELLEIDEAGRTEEAEGAEVTEEIPVIPSEGQAELAEAEARPDEPVGLGSSREDSSAIEPLTEEQSTDEPIEPVELTPIEDPPSEPSSAEATAGSSLSDGSEPNSSEQSADEAAST